MTLRSISQHARERTEIDARREWEQIMIADEWTHWIHLSPTRFTSMYPDKEIMLHRWEWDEPRRVNIRDVSPFFNVNGAWWKDVARIPHEGKVK